MLIDLFLSFIDVYFDLLAFRLQSLLRIFLGPLKLFLGEHLVAFDGSLYNFNLFSKVLISHLDFVSKFLL